MKLHPTVTALACGLFLLLFSTGCETLNNLGGMVTNLAKSHLPAKDARVRLGHPEGGYLGRLQTVGGLAAPTKAADAAGAAVFVLDNDVAGMTFRDGMEVVLRSAEAQPPAAAWLGVAGGRVALVDGSAGPELHTWLLQPLHVKDQGKAVMFGALVRLRNKATGQYLRPGDLGAELQGSKGDAFWSFELAPATP